MSIQRGGLKTWSALAGNKKRPSEYEVVTYKLHYRNRNPDVAYEQSPDSMMNLWYQKHVTGSPLKHSDWDVFRDPDQLTYRAYTTMQDGQEEYVDGLIREHARIRHDAGMSPAWIKKLRLYYTPLRYLFTAIQMASAYVVQMAPASTITNCAAFQEADALRWLSRTAYRTRQLSLAWPDQEFATSERTTWEDAPEWQGFRELIEKMLVTYDWAENLFALNVVALYAISEVCIRQFADLARQSGDTLSAMLCEAQMKDFERSRRWTAEWVKIANDTPGNGQVFAGWKNKWDPLADQAIDAYASSLGMPEAASTVKAGRQHFYNVIGIA